MATTKDTMVYLYQPEQGVLLLNETLQRFYALSTQQRAISPKLWLALFSDNSKQQLHHAFAALCFGNEDHRLQLALKLDAYTQDGAERAAEHRLCMIMLNQQPFICGRVTAIWYPHQHRRANYPQSACWSGRPFHESFQLG